jgi:phenylalanyl-tRNA synthetase alpha chain
VSIIAPLLEQAESEAAAAASLEQLDRVRVKYLGKKGQFTAELKALGKLPAEERPLVGKEINEAKQALTASLDARRADLEARKLEAELGAEAIDVTLPGRGHPMGRRHPVSRTLCRMVEILAQAGFEVAEGPEIEVDRKVLADIAVYDQEGFTALAEAAKEALPAS